MKLLFDENLSRQLTRRLTDLFPDSEHVIYLGLERAEDTAIWEYAKTNAYVIVTQDSDFAERSALDGALPKVIWIRTGNSVTSEIETLLRANYAAIHRFVEHPTDACLTLR